MPRAVDADRAVRRGGLRAARPRCRAGARGRTGWPRRRCRARRRTSTSTPGRRVEGDACRRRDARVEKSRNSLVKAAAPDPAAYTSTRSGTPESGSSHRSAWSMLDRSEAGTTRSPGALTPATRRAGTRRHVVGRGRRAAAARPAPAAPGRRCAAAGCRGPGSGWRRGARSPTRSVVSPSCTRSVSPVSRSWSTRQCSSSCHHARIRVCSPNSAPTSLNRSASGSWRVPSVSTNPDHACPSRGAGLRQQPAGAHVAVGRRQQVQRDRRGHEQQRPGRDHAPAPERGHARRRYVGIRPVEVSTGEASLRSRRRPDADHQATTSPASSAPDVPSVSSPRVSR